MSIEPSDTAAVTDIALNLDAAVQRAAIADWVYWQHLSVLMSDAISADVTV